MFELVVLVAGAIIFFKIGDTEFDGIGWLFAGISILASLAAMFVLPFGFLGVALTQVALFGALTLYKMLGNYKPRM